MRVMSTRFNALRHGVLSCYTVLPWEDAGEYRRAQNSSRRGALPFGERVRIVQAKGLTWPKSSGAAL